MPIISEKTAGILRLEISRPEKRNTLDSVMLAEFAEAIESASTSDDVRAVFIHAQQGLFCAGGDLNEQLTAPSADESSPTGRFIAALQACTKPIVACVQGPAVGLAVTILYYCDLVYASPNALFSLPFTALGLTPRFGVTHLAMQNAGYHKIAEKLLLSEPITAPEAVQMQLVTGLCEDAQVYAQSWARAQRLAQLPAPAVQGTKHLLRLARNEGLKVIKDAEAQSFEAAAASPEAKEACSAFLEGRTPSFKTPD